MNQKALVNIAYCPQKRTVDEFLDYLALNNNKAITENKSIIQLGGYNLKYFCKNEKQKLETILGPYDLIPIDVENPTRFPTYNRKHVDFLITDKSLKTLLVAAFELLINSDHLAQLNILKTVIGTEKESVDQTYF